MKRKLVLVLLILLLGATTLVNAQSNSGVGAQVVRQPAELIVTNHKDVGDVEFWNTRYNFQVSIQPTGDWLVQKVQVYAGKDLPPMYRNGKPILRKFNCNRSYRNPEDSLVVSCNLKDELEFTWGQNRERLCGRSCGSGTAQ